MDANRNRRRPKRVFLLCVSLIFKSCFDYDSSATIFCESPPIILKYAIWYGVGGGVGGGGFLNHYIQRNARRIQSILEIIVMPGDGLAPLGTRTFTGTAVTIWRAVLEISYD